MWEDDTGNNEYIYDCSDYQLAVKVGFIGVLVGIAYAILYRIQLFLFLESSTRDYNLYNLQANLLFQISFIGAIFVSIGYVGIFSMKNSKLGIVFPILVIIPNYVIPVIQMISFRLGVYSFEWYVLSLNVWFYASAIIGGLVLLTLRRVSVNPQLLYIIVFFSIISGFLPDVFWMLFNSAMTLPPVSIGLSSLITTLPYLITYLVSSLLLVKFFLIEREQSCIDANQYHEVPFPE